MLSLKPAGDLKLATAKDGLEAIVSGSIEVEGDAVINNRKNKLIPAYELEIKGGWSGALLADGAREDVNGLWKVPYLAEENADEDPEVQLSTATEAPAQQKAKAILLKQGKQVRVSFSMPCNQNFTANVTVSMHNFDAISALPWYGSFQAWMEYIDGQLWPFFSHTSRRMMSYLKLNHVAREAQCHLMSATRSYDLIQGAT